MKTLFFSVLFLLVSTLKAQIPPIFDYTWTIEKIVTGTQIITADLNPNGQYDTLKLNSSGIVLDNMTFYALEGGYFGNCEMIFYFDDINSELLCHLFGCLLSDDNSSIISNYFNEIFIAQNANSISIDNDFVPFAFGPLTYNFSTSGNTIYLHIINSIGEVATFYANNLSQQDFLKESISIYPNPAKNVLHVESSAIAIKSIKIYDLSGRLVIEKENVKHQINVSQLLQGVYILEIETVVGVLREKLVKE